MNQERKMDRRSERAIVESRKMYCPWYDTSFDPDNRQSRFLHRQICSICPEAQERGQGGRPEVQG